MYRTHTCGELRLENAGEKVTLCGWAHKLRDHGRFHFIDIRDRYGVTQIHIPSSDVELYAESQKWGREFVLRITGTVTERTSKNDKIPTGDIEINPESVEVLNPSLVPPFKIEDETDGLDDIRMQFRYLDLRRGPLQRNLRLRHQVSMEVRKYLDDQEFIEIETPYLIKSTPEGARDFVVPSRMNHGQFYALPQSPQTFKQILMVSGYDRYFQIVRCFRDEDLRADRQPEFTQIDCELSFVEQEDVLQIFEGMIKHIFKTLKGIELADFPRMTYGEAIEKYGSDKPDIRFEMQLHELTDIAQNREFNVFNTAEYVGGICVEGGASATRKEIDKLTNWVRRPQFGAKGLVWVKWTADGFNSSVKKFYQAEDFQAWFERMGGKEGDMLYVFSGPKRQSQEFCGELRKEMADRMGLRPSNTWQPLWVIDFPLLEEKEGRWHAMHHPFTAPKPEHAGMLESNPGAVLANAYDLTMNGVELGGGSIRIHNREMQERMFRALGFSDEEAQAQFGFLMGAFEYGAPPHGGIAFGFDRLCAIFGGDESIRDYIAFPKNNNGRDMMIDSPSEIDEDSKEKLHITIVPKKEMTETEA